MARKRRRSIVLLATIVTITVLDLMGASYGYWNDSLHISGALSTGTLEPIFAACVDLKEDQDKNTDTKLHKQASVRGLKVSFNEDRTVMEISGKVVSGHKTIINYGIANKGTVPAKFNQAQYNSRNAQTVPDGMTVTVSTQTAVYKPGLSAGDSAEGAQFQLEANSPGTYSFELALPFEQVNNN